MGKLELNKANTDKFNVKPGTPIQFFSHTLQREVDLSKDETEAIPKLIDAGNKKFSYKKLSN